MSKELLVGPKDERDILEILQAELDFLDKGGYGRSVKTPWLPTSVFQDSPSCFCFPVHDHNHACVLMQFVPPECRGESLPCHHLPLNDAGETVDLLERRGNPDETEEVVKNWLRGEIAQIKQEREAGTAFQLA
jgi:hypothetical protein